MTQFRVMSFNIRFAIGVDDGVNAWDNRAALNTQVIRQYAPDLIGFQELQPPQLEWYKTGLPEYAHYLGPQYHNDESVYAYPTIFYRTDRFDCLDAGGFWLSDTPHQFSQGWDAMIVRSAAWVRLQPRDNSSPSLLLLNTHLDHRGSEARDNGAALIAQQLADIQTPGEPVIVTGDFNCKPGSTPHKHFTDRGYRDTFAPWHQPDTYTSHRFTGQPPEATGPRRIDWILLRDDNAKLNVTDARIIYDAQPPLYPSDHFPIYADMQIV